MAKVLEPFHSGRGLEPSSLVVQPQGIPEESSSKTSVRDFPGGAVVKNPPANAGDTGSSPGPGRSHMPWSN